MPTPVAALLNRPETTFSRERSEDRGCRLLLSSMSAPEPLAPQFLGLMPLPMNSTAKRRGGIDIGEPQVVDEVKTLARPAFQLLGALVDLDPLRHLCRIVRAGRGLEIGKAGGIRRARLREWPNEAVAVLPRQVGQLTPD